MSQAPTDGMSLLDPWGFWKTARDANLEAWSKFMIDLVNSDEYAQATGLALEQALATSQPLRDAMERTMTQTLSLLNMPSRAEVISLAERLINVEMRLDDMDAKLNAVQSSLQETIKDSVSRVVTAQNTHFKDLGAQLEGLEGRYEAIKKIETQLSQLGNKLDTLQAPPAAPAPAPAAAAHAEGSRTAAATRPVTTATTPKPAATAVAKAEPKPAPKPEPKAATATATATATLPRAEAKQAPKPEPKPEPKAAAKKEQEAK